MEDLIITLADAISSIYLEVISVDSDISETISNFGLSLCALSTRALQKLRNEVSFLFTLRDAHYLFFFSIFSILFPDNCLCTIILC